MLRYRSDIIPRGGDHNRRSPLRNFRPVVLNFPASLRNEVQISIASLIFEMNKELNPKTNLIYYTFDGSNYCQEKDGRSDVCFFSFPNCPSESSSHKKPYICSLLGSNVTAEAKISKVYNIAIVETDIAFNLKGSFWREKEDTPPALNNLTPFLVILKHEILHALGFGHVETGVMESSFFAWEVMSDKELQKIEKNQMDSWNCITDSLFNNRVPFFDILVPEGYYDSLKYYPNKVNQRNIINTLGKHPYFKHLFDLDTHKFMYAQSAEDRLYWWEDGA